MAPKVAPPLELRFLTPLGTARPALSAGAYVRQRQGRRVFLRGNTEMTNDPTSSMRVNPPDVNGRVHPD
mgnify:FL=1